MSECVCERETESEPIENLLPKPTRLQQNLTRRYLGPFIDCIWINFKHVI